jgi:ABC-type sugar transport system permease subunit
MLRQIRKGLVWYVFVAPALILFLIFILYPTFEAFRLSFFREVVTEQQFAGAVHYLRLLGSQVFLGAILNTALLGIAFLVIIIPLALILATLLNSLRLWPNLFKLIFFLPQVTSAVAIALIFSYVFEPNWGLLNGALRLVGVPELPLWLADPRLSLTGSRSAATLIAVWAGVGYYILIYLAGLQAIPVELYDAAIVDGAGPLQAWWYVTIPSLRPTTVFLLLTGTIDAMSRFSDLYTLGGPGGAPGRSLQTVVMYIYQVSFESSDFNLASAAAVLFFAIVLVLTIINFRTFLQREFAGQA